ncbi:hypothetical protein [Falsiroseomonas oryziterrae]|uniref:hypothetical protein n=1 Tax=Falsiroseomonas oryziterrae TaxID=2911368 RepID=UPI001F44C63C|nr:hypothetical protein [Roseomonas sp. NPKOSM-4]
MIVLAMLLSVSVAQAQPARGWTEEKCRRYAAAWEEALPRFGEPGRDFVDSHAAFLASGCRGPRAACPRSDAEVALADAMTVAALNAGIAGTFLPFACRG